MSDPAELRAELEAVTRRLAEEHPMASLGRLLAGIVHEINTPISSILSNSQVILRSLEKLNKLLGASSAGPEAAEVLDMIQSLAEVDRLACERISEVVRGLKTFARAGEDELRKADVNEILRNTLKLARCEFRHRIAVETDLRELPEVECYPGLLSQVFLNILVNAGQAIQGEGRVTVSSRSEGACVHVSIHDTGSGIRPEHRDKLFTRGFSTKPVGVGTGLGLPLSRQIIEEKHGGSISFESELGVGTTFHIRIPVSQADRLGGPDSAPC